MPVQQDSRRLVSGLELLKHILLQQARIDRQRGLRTAGFVSGYRGSPLGGLDQLLWNARGELEALDVRFEPGLNEDLAASAVWGTQQVGLFPAARQQGVFAMWYGKGPGVDRCGDVFRHANAAGTSAHGGVLALAGDDHAAASSSLPHQSEPAFMAAGMPVLAPASLADLIEFGRLGIELSRFAGTWVGLKVVADVVEAMATVQLPTDGDVGSVVIPADAVIPTGGLNIRWPDSPLAQEERLYEYKLPAAARFAACNGLNRIKRDAVRPTLVVLGVGKSFADLSEALTLLGLEPDATRGLENDLALRIIKIGMPWPLDAQHLRQLVAGATEILVVEEKRPIVEDQVRAALGGTAAVSGKRDPADARLLSGVGTLTPRDIAVAMGRRLLAHRADGRLAKRLEEMTNLRSPATGSVATSSVTAAALAERTPYFCPGCPHNTSTRVPAGSRALAGIGCHYMAMWMDRSTDTFTHMGAEGVPWIGQAPFTDEKHVFANLGDGTYAHSGSLAIRAAVAAGVNITYKILYNGSVAMTGGQPIEGGPSVADIVAQVRAERVREVVVVTDDPDKYSQGTSRLTGAAVFARGELDAVQQRLAATPGVTVLVYDQQCATEKRRARKRGKAPIPRQRLFINPRVCEGCGDCGAQSNCLAVEPLETEYGTKRRINQSACNQDFSCVAGFCPSFVSVLPREGRRGASSSEGQQPAEPLLPVVSDDFNIVIAGIGGSGIVTIAQTLGAAAAAAGWHAAVLNQTGLAQKGGPVVGHVRLRRGSSSDRPARVCARQAALLLAADSLVAESEKVVPLLNPGAAWGVINTRVQPDARTAFDADAKPDRSVASRLQSILEPEAAWMFDATALAEEHFGDAIFANMIIVGYAYQRELLPLPGEALRAAIRNQNVAVTKNLEAFELGRRTAARDSATAWSAATQRQHQTLESLIDARRRELVDYQSVQYSERYLRLVSEVRSVEDNLLPGGPHRLTRLVAENFFKLLAYKDEYEVARLHTSAEFSAAIEREFGPGARWSFHFAPPLLARRADTTGRPRKKTFGPWMLPLLKMLRALRWLRGTRFDPFGHTEERRLERRLIDEYERDVRALLVHYRSQGGVESAGAVTDAELTLLAELAAWPAAVRGYGHLKLANAEKGYQKRQQLLQRLRRVQERRSRLQSRLAATFVAG